LITQQVVADNYYSEQKCKPVLEDILRKRNHFCNMRTKALPYDNIRKIQFYTAITMICMMDTTDNIAFSQLNVANLNQFII